MRNVSNKYKQTMENRRDFYAVGNITFLDGTEKTINKEDFTLSGNSVIDSSGSTSFPLGLLVPKQIKISLMNDDDRWSEYDFYGAKIRLQTKFDLDDGTTESLNIGTFTVIAPESYGTTVVVTAMDDSYKTDKPYDTQGTYPMSLSVALRDSCTTCDILLGTSNFPNSDYVIQNKPENLTHRQFIGLCAQIAGGNARFDEINRLQIISYDFSPFGDDLLDGGTFQPWNDGANVDGGTFSPWTDGDTYDGGDFNDRDNIHVLYQYKSGIVIEVDDVVITGVQMEAEDEEGNKVTHLYGETGYVLSLENQLATGKEDEVLERIGKRIVGIRFRPFSGDHIALPTAEFMDLAYVIDRKNNAYKTVLTDVTFNYFGYTNLKCSADSPLRNSSTRMSNEVKAIVEAQKLVERERSEREKAVETLQELLASGSGLYPSTETQPDGSTIWYLHDKPTREESQVVIKLTSEGIGISQDGGHFYPWGITFTGTAILDMIYTVGLDADYIRSGAIEIRKGNKTMVLMDFDSGQVILRPDIFELSSGETIEDIAGGAASDAVSDAMTQEAIFNKLTNGGETQGIYLQNGKLYLNATYMQIGKISSKNGRVYFDLDNNELRCTKLIGASGNNTPTAADIGNPDGTSTIASSFRVYRDGTPGTNVYMSVVASSNRANIGGTNINSLDINNGASLGLLKNSFDLSVSQSSGAGWAQIESDVANSRVKISENATISQDLTVQGNLRVNGTKPRAVETDDFGTRLQYCYEMASPMFGDIGEGVTDDNGECCIFLDDVFLETVSSQIEYQVFLQKEGQGDIWVEAKEPDYFTVKGTPGLRFAWEVKVSQRDYEFERLDDVESLPDEREADRLIRAAEMAADKESDEILQGLIEDAENESLFMGCYISDIEDFEMKTDAYLKNMEENGHGAN